MIRDRKSFWCGVPITEQAWGRINSPHGDLIELADQFGREKPTLCPRRGQLEDFGSEVHRISGFECCLLVF